ncbi:MAG: hypothetical protein RL071_3945 [Pseudomonadota bacterium]
MIPPGPDPENNRQFRLIPGRFDAPPAIADAELRESPGCGIAAYGLLLLGICLVGMTVGGLGTIGFIFGLVEGGARGPSELKAGVETPVYQLKPLRGTRLVGLTEVPAGFHDESEDLDGSVGCAMMTDRLVRVEGGAGLVLAYSQIDVVDVQGDEKTGMVVSAQGRDPQGQAQTLRCHFRAGEGGSRLAAQLEAERLAAAGPAGGAAGLSAPATAPVPGPAGAPDAPPAAPAAGATPSPDAAPAAPLEP